MVFRSGRAAPRYLIDEAYTGGGEQVDLRTVPWRVQSDSDSGTRFRIQTLYAVSGKISRSWSTDRSIPLTVPLNLHKHIHMSSERTIATFFFFRTIPANTIVQSGFAMICAHIQMMNDFPTSHISLNSAFNFTSILREWKSINNSC